MFPGSSANHLDWTRALRDDDPMSRLAAAVPIDFKAFTYQQSGGQRSPKTGINPSVFPAFSLIFLPLGLNSLHQVLYCLNGTVFREKRVCVPPPASLGAPLWFSIRGVASVVLYTGFSILGPLSGSLSGELS